MTVIISLKAQNGGVAYSDARVTYHNSPIPRVYDTSEKLYSFPNHKVVLLATGTVDIIKEITDRFSKAINPSLPGYPAYAKLLSDKAIEYKQEIKDAIVRDQLNMSFKDYIKPNQIDKELAFKVGKELERLDDGAKQTCFLLCGFDNGEYTARKVQTNGIIYAARPLFVDGASLDAEHRINKELENYPDGPTLEEGVMLVMNGSLEARSCPGVGGVGNLAILKDNQIREFGQPEIAVMHNLLRLEEKKKIPAGSSVEGIHKLMDGTPALEVLSGLGLDYKKFCEEFFTTRVL